MNKQVLLIDDDPIFHLILSRMIEKVDAECDVTAHLNGKIALDYLNENYRSHHEFLLFLDINMPVMNGWEFLNELKPLEMIRNKNINIHIVTSSTDLDDVKKAESYSFVEGIMSKPVSFDALNSILGKA